MNIITNSTLIDDETGEELFIVGTTKEEFEQTGQTHKIIPKSQVSTPFEMSEKEWADTKLLMTEIKNFVDKKYAPDGYNIGWNVGSVAGQEIAHAHLHIIPRYSDEPLAGKGIRYWFKQKENIRTSLLDENGNN